MTSTTQQRPKISDKKYQCLVCGNVEIHSTNHFGEIYCNCKKCGNGGLECMEPEAISSRKNNPVIVTKLHKYRFDISQPEQKKEYIALKAELKAKNYKLHDSISGIKHGYFDLLPCEIKIDISYVFDNQWNSSAGRVFDWKEEIYPNNKIKQGYWLELTDEHKKAREPKTYNCITQYMGELIGNDTILAINEGEASNQAFNKYWKDGMDIWSYKNEIKLIK